MASLIGIVPFIGSAWKMLKRGFYHGPRHRLNGRGSEIEVRQFNSKDILVEQKAVSIESYIFNVNMDENKKLRAKVDDLEREVRGLRTAVEGLKNLIAVNSEQREMKTLRTWGLGSSFTYSGSIESGTRIMYGKGFTVYVTPEQYSSLLDYFRDMTVDAGTSRTNPPRNSVGEWLRMNVTKTAVASYVCPILIDEGFAERVGKSQIAFVKK